MQLTGPQLAALSEGLDDAFTIEELARILTYRLNQKLDSHAAPGAKPHRIYELLVSANGKGWIDRLIVASHDAAPGNPKLVLAMQQFGLAPFTETRATVERTIRADNPLLDPMDFLAGLGTDTARVARIEIATNKGSLFGTGFLVGPRVMITNHHVIECLLGPTVDGVTAKPENVTVRFDYKVMRDPANTIVYESPGRSCGLDPDWHIDSSPDAPDAPGGRGPGAEELDYALIRLNERAGDDTLDHSGAPAATKRGFVAIPAGGHGFATGSSLFILQHPKGGPVKLGLDTRSVIGLFDDGRRVRYTTNTEGGSSGSPCYTPEWKVVALHHAGDPDFRPAHRPVYNQGIPISLIRDLITKRGLASFLGPE